MNQRSHPVAKAGIFLFDSDYSVSEVTNSVEIDERLSLFEWEFKKREMQFSAVRYHQTDILEG